MSATEARSIFATRLYNLRARNGMTQQKLASLIGVTQQSIWKWETDRSEPNIEKLRRLAELFKVPTDVLLGLSDMTEPSEDQPDLSGEIYRPRVARVNAVISDDFKSGASVLVRASELEDVVQRLVSRYMAGNQKLRPEPIEHAGTEESAAAN